MRIITDIYKQNGLSIDDIINGYSDGKGIDWLLNKRIDSLVKLGFITQKNKKLTITSRYVFFITMLSEYYKSLIKIGKGGV